MSRTKHFHSTTFGEIKAVLGTDEDGHPEIRFVYVLNNTGEASISIGFDIGGESLAEEAFESLDSETAEKVVEVGAENLQSMLNADATHDTTTLKH